MPSADEHLTKARHNEEFLAGFELDSSLYLDWYVVVLFYSALHYVDCYIRRSYNSTNMRHRERNKFISQEKNLKRVDSEYGALFGAAWNARYALTKFDKTQIEKQLRPRFEKVRDHVLKLIA